MRLRLAVIPVIIAAAIAVAYLVPAVRVAVVTALGLDDHPANAHSALRDGPGLGNGNRHLRITAQPAPPRPMLLPTNVRVNPTTFFSWALLDRQTGRIAGSNNHATEDNSTESMIKAWIAADYLRQRGAQKPTPQRLAQLTRMIRDSDDKSAQDIYLLGGGNAVIKRMISICGLTRTRLVPGWWSQTEMTARDAVLLGQCVADGRAAGRKWTTWILGEMRQVRGGVDEQPNGGRWGIIDALPAHVAPKVGIKNGWTEIGADRQWHLNCLAVHDEWVLAVLTRYPAENGKRYGAEICRSVTQQLLTGT